MKAVIFDVGNVLLRWDPRVLLRRLLASEAEVDAFMAAIDFPAWNLSLDAGKDWDTAVAEAASAAPLARATLEAYRSRWLETIPGPVPGSVEILEALGQQGRPLYAITNYSVEKWDQSVARFPFLATAFRDVVVSGQVRITKPDPRIYQLLLHRNGLRSGDCVFIDDSAANVAAAAALGIDAIRFTDATALADDLRTRSLLT